MKKSILARGFIGSVASLLGVMAVGCGADVGPEGAAGNGEIGSAEQALVAADIVSRGVMAGRAFHTSCKVTVGGVDFVIAAAGETAAGTYSDDVEVLKTTTQTWFNGGSFNNVLPAAVAFAQMIQDPDDAEACLHFGGELANGTVQGQVRKIKLNLTGGNPSSVTVSDPVTSGTFTARSQFQLLPCGTGNLLAIGGKGALTSLQVYNSGVITTLKNTNGTPANVSLITGRSDFAAAVRPDQLGISIAGGIDSLGNKVDEVESMKLTSACALDSTSATTPTQHPDLLTDPRSGLKMWYRDTDVSSRDTFVVAVGEDDTFTESVVTETVRINFANLTNATDNDIAATTSANVATINPAFAFVSGKGYLIGGVDSAGAAIAEAQEYDLALNPDYQSDDQDSLSAFLQVREGGSATVANGKVWVVGGKDGVDYTVNTLEIAP